ncbi:unnamed protein product [Closterium sp. Naga37s-1]|nr:unnamed protein product [Closterium sp. Naga37s-1]
MRIRIMEPSATRISAGNVLAGVAAGASSHVPSRTSDWSHSNLFSDTSADCDFSDADEDGRSAFGGKSRAAKSASRQDGSKKSAWSNALSSRCADVAWGGAWGVALGGKWGVAWAAWAFHLMADDGEGNLDYGVMEDDDVAMGDASLASARAAELAFGRRIRSGGGATGGGGEGGERGGAGASGGGGRKKAKANSGQAIPSGKDKHGGKNQTGSGSGWSYTGDEYAAGRGRRAGGDVKKEGKLEPHAYWPLDAKMLNRRAGKLAAAQRGMTSVMGAGGKKGGGGAGGGAGGGKGGMGKKQHKGHKGKGKGKGKT